MRFLVDMNLAVPVAAWLRARAHDAVHMLEAGLAEASDAAVFDRAQAEGRTALTCDLDFGELVMRAGERKVSVVIFRLTSQRLDRLLPRLSRVLDECAPALAEGAVVVAEEARLRVRRLPLRP